MYKSLTSRISILTTKQTLIVAGCDKKRITLRLPKKGDNNVGHNKF